MTTTATTPTGTMAPAMAAATRTAVRVVGAVLALEVTAIHIIDQGGIPGSKTPAYVGGGYYLLELAGLLAAALLFAGMTRPGWFVTIGVACGPLVGYVLSRGPGLPGYDDDRGNWCEPLGLMSLIVEGALLVLAVTMFLREIKHR